jgi:branched-chain amino acid transport system ATP-binding protein
MRNDLLTVRHLFKSFQGVKAVEDVSLDVSAGEITSIIGPNGAGKTTLFNCITGVTEPDRAEIVLTRRDGEQLELGRLNTEDICRVGVGRTFQQVRLFDSLSVLDNVVLGGLYRQNFGWWAALGDRLFHGAARHRALRTHAAGALEKVGLAPQALELAGNLDHGNRRRAEIARALAAEPLLLLLDEPAAGMNRVETDRLMVLLGDLRRDGIGIVLIEHDMKLVMQISNRVYAMDHGELLASGMPDAVAADPRVIEAYLGKAAVVSC